MQWSLFKRLSENETAVKTVVTLPSDLEGPKVGEDEKHLEIDATCVLWPKQDGSGSAPPTIDAI